MVDPCVNTCCQLLLFPFQTKIETLVLLFLKSSVSRQTKHSVKQVATYCYNYLDVSDALEIAHGLKEAPDEEVAEFVLDPILVKSIHYDVVGVLVVVEHKAVEHREDVG